MPEPPQIARDLFAMQARYNTWFNRELARAAAGSRLPGLLVQINHLYVMDCLWLHRFGVCDPALPLPRTMDEIRFRDTRQWHRKQAVADKALEGLVANTADTGFQDTVEFRTMAENQRMSCPLWALLAHLFNHQSLHRGEILCLLRMHGVGFGQSDLLPFSPLIPRADDVIAHKRLDRRLRSSEGNPTETVISRGARRPKPSRGQLL